MTTSQNGWSVSTNKAAIGVVDFKVEGVSFPGGVRKGDVATVLGYVVERLHKEVEKLHSGWCWGYDYKPIEGSSTISNHASGTAVDFNAPNHPMGSSGTFSATQVATIHKILAVCSGCVRWGGDYTGRKDEMHFEINCTPATLAKLAARLRGTPAPPVPPKPPVKPPVTAPVLKKGSTGSDVKSVQAFLNRTFPAYRNSVSVNRGHLLVEDGIYGDATVAWVKEFQSRVSIAQDGMVGVTTRAKLKGYGWGG